MNPTSAGVTPKVSVVVNTDGRASAVKALLASLRLLDYPSFEVCLVCGPTPDGTREFAATLMDNVKVLHCPERNLSQSRNIGIAAAAGEVIAFIDDDGIPEPDWLTQLVEPYARVEVGGSGGLVYDHTGAAFQYRFAGCDRLGNAQLDLDHPLSDNNYPFTTIFPYIQGTNSSFRRAAIVGIGGFDEEYEFYLDETDVCCRLIDAGYEIAQLGDARVHHKFLPSNIRNSDRVTVKKYAVIKNKIYFSFVCNRGHFTEHEAISDAVRFIEEQRQDLKFHLRAGRVSQLDLAGFEADAGRAWRTGLTRGLSGLRRTRPLDFFNDPPAFLPFPAVVPEHARRTIVFLSQAYAPTVSSGVARYTHDIAQALGSKGHNVHVITSGDLYDRVDLEDDVWVHRLARRAQPPAPLVGETQIPQHIWEQSATALTEIQRISSQRTIDIIEAVSWDCEGAAALLASPFPVAINVVTTLSHWLETHPEQRDDTHWMETFGSPMLALERYMFEHSPLVISASHAISADIERLYDVRFPADVLNPCPHGLQDMRPMDRRKPSLLHGDKAVKAVLFVGRLEFRKGIDKLLEAAPEILASDPDVHVWIAGKALPLVGELTAPEIFLRSDIGHLSDRVHFLGEVGDEELRWLYDACALLVAPSRFESFGLIVPEAGMFGKPVVAAAAGGMAELVEPGITGLLTAPGDARDLARAVIDLLRDDPRRTRMGEAGRQRFDHLYSAASVAEQRLALYRPYYRQKVSLAEYVTAHAALRMPLDQGRFGVAISNELPLRVEVAHPSTYITFLKHAWSGEAEVRVNDRLIQTVDLFSTDMMEFTLRLKTPRPGTEVSITRIGRHNELAQSDEVIVTAIAQAGL